MEKEQETINQVLELRDMNNTAKLIMKTSHWYSSIRKTAGAIQTASYLSKKEKRFIEQRAELHKLSSNDL